MKIDDSDRENIFEKTDGFFDSKGIPESDESFRILGIDDNESILNLYQKILTDTSGGASSEVMKTLEEAIFETDAPKKEKKRLPFLVDLMQDGEQACKKAQNAKNEGRPYAVAFVDMRMPGGWDGMQTIESLWSIDPDLQVVICTAYSDYSWDGITNRLGFSDNLLVLRKPFEKIEVLQLATSLSQKWALHCKHQQDITEQKCLIEKFRSAKAQADSANLAKSQFLANMSHEIRTPLNAILGFSQILMNRAKKISLPAEFAEFLKNVQLSGQNLAELINNILDLSKIEAGKMEISEEALNLEQLFRNVYHMNRSQALQKGLEFSYDFDSKLPEIILSDRTKLNQILINLTSNAIKFTPRGKKVKMHAFRQAQQLVLEVADEGIGIPPEKQDSIFESFEQVDSSLTRRLGGSGLGLAIVKQTTLLLKGEIEVQSTLGKGSRFSVSLPLVEQDQASIKETDFPIDNVQFSGKQQVLMVEDNEMNQRMIQALFGDLGLELHIADNGRTGIEKALQLKPDLILMDLHMPDMDGLTAIQQIRQNPEIALIPIVITSADAFTEQKAATYEFEIQGYLTKPLNFGILVPLLEKYLSGERSLPPERSAGESNPPLPEAHLQQLREELRILAQTPIIMEEKVHKQIQKMKQVCEGYATPYWETLRQIEEAFSQKDDQQWIRLINDALSKLVSRDSQEK